MDSKVTFIMLSLSFDSDLVECLLPHLLISKYLLHRIPLSEVSISSLVLYLHDSLTSISYVIKTGFTVCFFFFFFVFVFFFAILYGHQCIIIYLNQTFIILKFCTNIFYEAHS